MPAAKPLIDTYREWLDVCIDDDGVAIPHGLILDGDEKLTVIALAVEPDQAYRIMVAQFEQLQAKEAIFALDRFTKPGQGTTLGDVMAGHHLTRAGTRPFIIEYQHDPRIVKPICWDNPFWNAVLAKELLDTLRSILGMPAGIR